jgi:hypothetical protein
MKKDAPHHLRRCRLGRVLWSALLIVLLPMTAISGIVRESEPNNTMESATPAFWEDLILGVLDDEMDWYKITLPAKGEYTLLLSGFPKDAAVRVEIFGFGQQHQISRGFLDSTDEHSLALAVNAEETFGYVRVSTAIDMTYCEGGWCIARFSPNGSFYVLNASTDTPVLFGDTPVLGSAEYIMSFRQK